MATFGSCLRSIEASGGNICSGQEVGGECEALIWEEVDVKRRIEGEPSLSFRNPVFLANPAKQLISRRHCVIRKFRENQ